MVAEVCRKAAALLEARYALCHIVTYVTDGHRFPQHPSPLPSRGPGEQRLGWVTAEVDAYYGGHLTHDAASTTTPSAAVQFDSNGSRPPGRLIDGTQLGRE